MLRFQAIAFGNVASLIGVSRDNGSIRPIRPGNRSRDIFGPCPGLDTDFRREQTGLRLDANAISTLGRPIVPRASNASSRPLGFLANRLVEQRIARSTGGMK